MFFTRSLLQTFRSLSFPTSLEFSVRSSKCDSFDSKGLKTPSSEGANATSAPSIDATPRCASASIEEDASKVAQPCTSASISSTASAKTASAIRRCSSERLSSSPSFTPSFIDASSALSDSSARGFRPNTVTSKNSSIRRQSRSSHDGLRTTITRATRAISPFSYSKPRRSICIIVLFSIDGFGHVAIASWRFGSNFFPISSHALI